MFSFFSSSEKSEIEREHRSLTGNLPYQLPYDLKNKITGAADELKNLKMRRYEKKTRILDQKDQATKRETEQFKREKSQIEQRFRREIDDLTKKYNHSVLELARRSDQEIDGIIRADKYAEERLLRQIQDLHKEIQTWQKNNKK